MNKEITLSKGEMSYVEDNDTNLNHESILNIATFDEGGGGGGPQPTSPPTTLGPPVLKSIYIAIL